MNSEVQKKEIQKAEYIWSHLSRALLVDANLTDKILTEELLNLSVSSPVEGGWLKACRTAQLLTQGEVASRLGMSQQAYAKLEVNEAAAGISLESLQKAAEALGCELVYFLRPKRKKKFSKMIWEQILPKALKVYKTRIKNSNSTRQIRPSVLGHIAFELFKTPDFRREKKWIRKNDSDFV